MPRKPNKQAEQKESKKKKKRDCTKSSQVFVKNQQVGRQLIGNFGCLPKISLIKASAFCSLRCVVFIFSMSEARGGWQISLLLFLRARNKAEGSVKAKGVRAVPQMGSGTRLYICNQETPSPGTTGPTIPTLREPFPNTALRASAWAIPVPRILSLLQEQMPPLLWSH